MTSWWQWLTALTAGALLFPAPFSRGLEPVAYEPEFYQVSDVIQTPHIAWAKPYAGGKLRALVIAPWACQRTTVEVQQRLDADVTVAFTTLRAKIGYDRDTIQSWAMVSGLFNDEIEASLREKLRGEYDVILLGTDWNALPLWTMYEILRKIDAGAGLVIGYRQSGEYLDRLMALGTPDPAASILAGLTVDGVPNLGAFSAAKPPYRLSALGRGRVLQLLYPIGPTAREYLTPPEREPATRQDYEIYQSIALRAILWAARREPPVQLLSLAPQEWSRAAAPPKELTFTLAVRDAVWRARIDVHWCDAAGNRLATSSAQLPLTPGDNTVTVATPVLPAGEAYANVRVFRDDAVAGWGCLRVPVTTDVAIAGIDFAKPLFAAADPIAVQVKLTAPLLTDLPIRFTVRDAFDRIVATSTVPAGKGSTVIAAALTLPAPLGVWHELTAELGPGNAGAAAAAVARAEFFREWRRPADDFMLVAWYGAQSTGYAEGLIARALAAGGVTTVYPSHVWGKGADQRVISHVRAGMDILPYVCSVGESRERTPGDVHARQPPVTDPAYQTQLREQVADCARQFRRFCPVGYSLGDENAFTSGVEYCTAPMSAAYFRDWLKRRYPDLAALNRAWQTQVASFTEVKPVLLEEARANGNPAPWIDFRLCMEDSWSGIFAELSQTIRAEDPPAKVGHEGSGTLDSLGGFDWWTMLRDLQLFVPYPGTPSRQNLVRSLRPSGTISGYWYGAYTSSCGGRRLTTQRYVPWYCLFQGFNSSWYFNTWGDAGMPHEVGFAADMRPLPHFQETAATCREIRSGYDKLLLTSERQADGIALFYSPAAIHENSFRARPIVPAAELDAWCYLLNDLALGYEFVAAEQLRQGVLATGKYRLLILPLACAMSAEEVAAVRKFVDNGGALVADLAPAVADEHGHAWPVQPLAGLFGKQPGPAEVKFTAVTGTPAEGGVTLTDGRRLLTGGSARAANAERGALTVGGTLQNTAVCLRAGKRPALLLNLALDGYSKGRRTAEGAALRTLLGDALAALGTKPAVTVTGADGERTTDVQLFRFAHGAATFVGVLPEDFNATVERNQAATLRFAGATHVYDVRRKRYLGRRSAVPVTLQTCRAELFALLPQPLGELTLTAESTGTPAGRTLRTTGALRTGDGKPAGDWQVITLVLRDPTGNSRPAYQNKLQTAGGRFQATWTLAENDPAGRWAVEATDLISGLEERAWVQVPDSGTERPTSNAQHPTPK